VPTEKQRRQAAQRRLARQLDRRREAARKRRQRSIIGGTAAAVIVIVVVVVLIVVNVGGKSTPAAQPSSPSTTTPTATPTTKSATPTVTASPYPTPTFAKTGTKVRTTNGPCRYAESSTLRASPYTKDVGLPPDPKTTPAKGTVTATIATTEGPITLTLERAMAPCAVQSFIYLAKAGFYNKTACPRMVTSGIFVLQCGDPSNSQRGGPTYAYKQETTAKTDYSAGVVAMANTGQRNSTGSQFFFIYKDSNQNAATSAGLAKSYSVIGKVTSGLPVITKVAAKGVVPSDPSRPGDGKPILGLTITSVKLTA